MEKLSKKISELQQFADIMATKDEKWLVRFKEWLQSIIRVHCRHQTLVILSENSPMQSQHYNEPIDDLAEAMYNAYYKEILKSVKYRKEKLEWWYEANEAYNQAKPVYNRLKNRGIVYMVSHLKKLKKCADRIKARDISLDMTDIVEIAFARYAAEAKGNYLSFEKFMH